MVRKLSPACRRGRSSASLVLGERGDRSLLLPSVSQSRQPARALGGRQEASFASSRRGPLPSTWLRRSLDSSLVRASSLPTPTEKPESLHHTRGNREEATGTVSCLKIAIDYLDQGAVNYRDHSQQIRTLRKQQE